MLWKPHVTTLLIELEPRVRSNRFIFEEEETS